MVTLSTPTIATNKPIARVEILGVFGSGKTTLGNRLIESNASLLAEDHQRNPFWGQSAAIDAIGYLGYELSFLLQHSLLVTSAKHDQLAVCDWSFASDLLWASLRLDKDLAAYKAVHEILLQRLGQPKGYLFLKQHPDTIIERLGSRARQNEESFRQYVHHACTHLETLAATLPTGSVLVVNDETTQKNVTDWLKKK